MDGQGTPRNSRHTGGVNTFVHTMTGWRVVGLGMDTVVFWASSVVSCAVFDDYHHHIYVGGEYSA